MTRPSEPVRTQKRETEIDEKACSHRKSKGQVEHGAALHPVRGADAKRERRKGGKAKREVGDVEHDESPGGLTRTIRRYRVKALFRIRC
jgi:hypothetical protein